MGDNESENMTLFDRINARLDMLLHHSSQLTTQADRIVELETESEARLKMVNELLAARDLIAEKLGLLDPTPNPDAPGDADAAVGASGDDTVDDATE